MAIKSVTFVVMILDFEVYAMGASVMTQGQCMGPQSRGESWSFPWGKTENSRKSARDI